MRVVRQNQAKESRSCGTVLVLASLLALGSSPVAAQIESAAADAQPGGDAGEIEGITADEEITVVGQRTLRDLRLEVQLERERVYGLFNLLNSDDQFDIHCTSVPRTGTRIPQRVCRPQFADDATHDVGEDFTRELQRRCGLRLTEECLESGRSVAQAGLAIVPIMDRELAAEVDHLTRENAEFRRAIADYQAVERRYEEARRVVASGLRVSASVIEADGGPLPSSLSLRQGEIVAPEPIELSTPETPWSDTDDEALREAWVKLRYSVLADGTTADVQVVDTMPPGLDASSPVAAAKAWTFEPARVDGAPVDWHNHLGVVTVKREQAVHEGWARFAEAYEAAAALVADSDYEEAKSRNARMHDELAATLEEMAFAEMQRAGIEHAIGDPHAALDAIRRATEPAVEQLGEADLMLALEHRFALEFELGRAADALATYDRRRRLGRLPSREPLARNAAALEQALALPETGLAARGRIDGDGKWAHSLTWPTIAVGDVDGAVEGLELLCNRGTAALPLEEDVQMNIPAGWGECVLLVDGRPDTSFVVYELRVPID
jgi:hypothetical protein